jgi:hypothetical protein
MILFCLTEAHLTVYNKVLLRSMLTKLKCPLCEKEFELNEALDSDLRGQILATVEEEHQRHIEEVRSKAIEETRQLADEKQKKDLEEVRKQAFEQAKKAVDDKYSTDLEFMKKQLEEKDKKVSEYRSQELQFRKEKADIVEEKKELELTVQRRVDAEKKT